MAKKKIDKPTTTKWWNVFRYKEDGHCKGEPEFDQLPAPTRLQWDIPEKVQCYVINTNKILVCPASQGEITDNLHAVWIFSY